MDLPFPSWVIWGCWLKPSKPVGEERAHPGRADSRTRHPHEGTRQRPRQIGPGQEPRAVRGGAGALLRGTAAGRGCAS